jgi:hypothetical protein
VFLLLDERQARQLDDGLTPSQDFLHRIVETNAIGFGDERTSAAWTAGYYINNARYRIERLMQHEMPDSLERQLLTSAWTSCFDLLKAGIDNGFPMDR